MLEHPNVVLMDLVSSGAHYSVCVLRPFSPISAAAAAAGHYSTWRLSVLLGVGTLKFGSIITAKPIRTSGHL